MKYSFVGLGALVVSLSVSAYGGGFDDDFSDPMMKGRQALRGQWKFADNEASCVADPDLYIEFKNHGPILRWPCEFQDGTVELEFRPKRVQRLVFTLNNVGHVFRVTLSDETRTRVFGWSGPSKDNKPETLAKEGVPLIADLEGEWVKVKVVINGEKASLTIGDYSTQLKHASLGREKGEVTISFAQGELTVRNVRVTTGPQASGGASKSGSAHAVR